jgi:hypothetical protein
MVKCEQGLTIEVLGDQKPGGNSIPAQVVGSLARSADQDTRRRSCREIATEDKLWFQ